MRKIILFTIIILLISCSSAGAGNRMPEAGSGAEAGTTAGALYDRLQLAGAGVSFEAFAEAIDGYNSVEERRREVLTLIDFTMPSTARRLWVIDMATERVLFNTWVAHGQGSGGNYATAFSNRSGSHQSSPGLYVTGATYNGRNGYSMLLDGLQPGVNDNARSRAIVVHGAAYANPSVIASTGRLGRSWGCPALPADVARPVIDAIKEGSILYIYAGAFNEDPVSK